MADPTLGAAPSILGFHVDEHPGQNTADGDLVRLHMAEAQVDIRLSERVYRGVEGPARRLSGCHRCDKNLAV